MCRPGSTTATSCVRRAGHGRRPSTGNRRRHSPRTRRRNPMADTTADAWVFPWDEARKRPRDHGYAMPFVGPDNVANIFSVHVSIVEPGYRPHEPHTHDDEEAIYLLEGKLEV